jgi:thioesterase domain-containing protein
MAGSATRALDPDVKSGSEVVLETTNAPRSPERSELSRRPAVYPASLGQQRLWFLNQLDHAAGAAYHLASGWRLQGRLDEVALRAALDTVVARYAVLRTRFALLDEQPMQQIAPADAGFHWVEHELAGLSAEAQRERTHELSAREAIERPLPSRSLEAITTDYVHLIREAQPHGPYILIGLCVAGLIAYEAARQLRQAGEPVALVVMADTWCPGYVVRSSFLQSIALNFRRKRSYRRHRLALLRSGIMRIDEFLATTRLGKWNGLMRLLSAWRLIEDPSTFNQARCENRWFLPALESARDNYHPPESTGDVVLLQSNALPVADFVDAKMGWSSLVTGHFLHYRLPGWHDRMFHDEGAAMIAEHLRPLLDRVDAAAHIFEGQLVKRTAALR